MGGSRGWLSSALCGAVGVAACPPACCRLHASVSFFRLLRQHARRAARPRCGGEQSWVARNRWPRRPAPPQVAVSKPPAGRRGRAAATHDATDDAGRGPPPLCLWRLCFCWRVLYAALPWCCAWLVGGCSGAAVPSCMHALRWEEPWMPLGEHACLASCSRCSWWPNCEPGTAAAGPTRQQCNSAPGRRPSHRSQGAEWLAAVMMYSSGMA